MILYNENFDDFPLEEFPYNHGHTAAGEYHYVSYEGYKGNWYDPIELHQWRSQEGSWIIQSLNGKRYLRQNRGDYVKGHFADVSAMLVLREMLYSSYQFKMKLRLLDTRGYCGMMFNYITSRNYYAFCIKEDEAIIFKKYQDQLEVIAKKEFKCDEYEYYDIKIEVNNNLKAYINDELLFDIDIEIYPSKCGVIGRGAALYTDILVEMDRNSYDKHLKYKNDYNDKLRIKSSKYPPLKLLKKIEILTGGSGRQIRFGNYNGVPFFILAQHQKMIMRDSFVHISCLTAYDFDGNLLWQKGENNDSYDTTVTSCDLPFQIADINGDNIPELIYAYDFYIIICDAFSGKELYRFKTPLVDDLMKDKPYKRLNVDAIRVADFKGVGYPSDFIIKDRYENVFAFDKDMNLLWRYHLKNTGHFPYIYDFNGDGRDEMFVGYSMVSSDGDILWSLPIETDHTDEIIYINLKDNDEKRLYLASGNEGFNVCNLDGTIYSHNEIGHAQRISIADYNGDGNLEVMVASFWGSNNDVYFFDSDLKRICEREFMTNGITITPISYDGKHMLALASAYEGLIDSNLDTVVKFPNDNHPVLCCEGIDIDHDGITEILCWDQHSMYIYKASSFTPIKIEEYPLNAMSNYRGEYIKKQWKRLLEKKTWLKE